MTDQFVYEFIYNSDTNEGGAITQSIHKTLKGAEMAMEFNKNIVKQQWLQDCIDFPETAKYPFDYGQYWGVRKTGLKQ